jgi:hypothetical protein
MESFGNSHLLVPQESAPQLAPVIEGSSNPSPNGLSPLNEDHEQDIY